jgi:hypothetical protein
MLYGLDALFHGAVIALFVAVPATILFWSLTRPLAPGARWARPLVTAWAGFGLTAALGALYALAFERVNFEDEAMAGAMIVGGAAQLLAFLILLALPRRSRS